MHKISPGQCLQLEIHCQNYLEYYFSKNLPAIKCLEDNTVQLVQCKTLVFILLSYHLTNSPVLNSTDYEIYADVQ